MEQLPAHSVELTEIMEWSVYPRPCRFTSRRGLLFWLLNGLLIASLASVSAGLAEELHQRISGKASMPAEAKPVWIERDRGPHGTMSRPSCVPELRQCSVYADLSPANNVIRTAGDVLEDDPVGRLKVFVYDLPAKYNTKMVEKDPRCLNHMFATEIFLHRFLLESPVRTLDPEEADWFYAPVYTTCDLTTNGLPLPFKAPRMMRSAIQYISVTWPYWNRTEGADHFFTVPHDFGACFHYQEEQAIQRGILHLLSRATLVQTFGQRFHVCLNEGSIVVPPYAPPSRMQSRFIPPSIPRSIFVYFRGLFYDPGNDPEGGYYSRGARAAVWENFKNNILFDISSEHPGTYYEDMQRSVFCLCPLGWAPWSPRLVEGVQFGCIPVIIADDIVLPFADAIPWEKIGVFVDEKDVPVLDKILTSIPIEQILEKQRLLANPAMKQAMLFPQPAQPGDAFHQILNGLARKLPHDSSIYQESVQRVLNWTSGPPGDLYPWLGDKEWVAEKES